MFLVRRRSNDSDQFWKRGSVSPSGETAGTPPPLAIVGSMNGGQRDVLLREPASR